MFLEVLYKTLCTVLSLMTVDSEKEGEVGSLASVAHMVGGVHRKEYLIVLELSESILEELRILECEIVGESIEELDIDRIIIECFEDDLARVLQIEDRYDNEFGIVADRFGTQGDRGDDPYSTLASTDEGNEVHGAFAFLEACYGYIKYK